MRFYNLHLKSKPVNKMSAYSFIASNYELSEINNIRQKVITVREAIKLKIKPHELIPWEDLNLDYEIIIVNDESDLDELVIRRVGQYYRDDIKWYTDKAFIYTVEFRYTNNRAKQLIDYLKENIKEGNELELWSIWLDDKQNVMPNFVNSKEISISHIKQMYDWEDENHVDHSCIILKDRQ